MKGQLQVMEEEKTLRDIENLVTCAYCGNEWEEQSNEDEVKCPECSVPVRNNHRLTKNTSKYCTKFECSKKVEGPTSKCTKHTHGAKTEVGVKRFKEDLNQ